MTSFCSFKAKVDCKNCLTNLFVNRVDELNSKHLDVKLIRLKRLIDMEVRAKGLVWTPCLMPNTAQSFFNPFESHNGQIQYLEFVIDSPFVT